MLIYRNAEGVHSQRKFGNHCAKLLSTICCDFFLSVAALLDRVTGYPQRRYTFLQPGRDGFTNRLSKLKPRASRSKSTSGKLWYAQSQFPMQDEFD